MGGVHAVETVHVGGARQTEQTARSTGVDDAAKGGAVEVVDVGIVSRSTHTRRIRVSVGREIQRPFGGRPRGECGRIRGSIRGRRGGGHRGRGGWGQGESGSGGRCRGCRGRGGRRGGRVGGRIRQPGVGSQEVRAAVAIGVIGARRSKVKSGGAQGRILLGSGEVGIGREQQGQPARDVRRGQGCARRGGIETTEVGRVDVHARRDQVGKDLGGAAAIGGPAAAQAVDQAAGVDRSHRQRRRIVGRAEAGGISGAAIARRKDGQDARRAQGLQVGLEVEVAARGGKGPGVVDHLRRVSGGRVAVWVEHPLVTQVDGGGGGLTRVVEDAGGDPLSPGRHADGGSPGIAADHHAHRSRAVSTFVDGRGGMLAEGVVPAVGPAAPAIHQVGMGEIHAAVQRPDHHPLPRVAEVPKRWRVDEGQARLGSAHRGRQGGGDHIDGIGEDDIHVG